MELGTWILEPHAAGELLGLAVSRGEVLEWLIRPVSKTGGPQKGPVGSNPTLSANRRYARYAWMSRFALICSGASLPLGRKARNVKTSDDLDRK